MPDANQPRCRVLACVPVLALVAAPCARAADDATPFTRLEDVVIVRADKAWEGVTGDAMYFEGRLELSGDAWHIYADRARLVGKLGSPEQVVVDGAPARLVVDAGAGDEPIEGHGQHLEFEPATDTLRLAGRAMIVKGGQSISSESIQYWLARGTFAAGSHGRVKVVVQPDLE